MTKEVWLQMGFARKRVGKDGKTRYTATYVDLRGSIRSAGTFASEKAADRAWQQAEVELRQGRVGDPARGRQTFQKYVEERWLPSHVLEPTTREKYTYYLAAYIVPALGPMRMADIFPEHIREWIAQMQRERRSAWTIQYCKGSILNSIFTTALNDQVTYIHPCRGVKIPTVPATPRTIITPEQFDAIYGTLPRQGTVVVELPGDQLEVAVARPAGHDKRAIPQCHHPDDSGRAGLATTIPAPGDRTARADVPADQL